MFKVVFALAMATSLGACVTTPETRAQEMAYCERMERDMGLEHSHSHAEAKGMGMNPMHVTHSRCRQMLGMS